MLVYGLLDENGKEKRRRRKEKRTKRRGERDAGKNPPVL